MNQDCAPAVRRLNKIVERVDELSGYRFDRCSADRLADWLLARGLIHLATELQSAARAAKCWEDNQE